MFTRADIVDYMWSYAVSIHSNIVDVYVHHLRRKLDNTFSANPIKTVRGSGYRLAVGDADGAR